MTDKFDYKTPKLTVDIIIALEGDAAPECCNDPTDPYIVFIERAHPPLGIALPGGFVDDGEPTWQAAIREAKEETGIDIELVELFHAYSNPTRDARLHAVSLVYIAKGFDVPKAGSDAKTVGSDFLSQIRQRPIAFDHALILSDYATYLKNIVRPDWYR